MKTKTELIERLHKMGFRRTLGLSVEQLESKIEECLTIYNLELHEGLLTEFGIWVMRVHSGWLYDCWDFEKDQFKQGVFVPYKL